MLESNTPLSRSVVWQLQRAFFTRHGMRAWQSGVVPHFITNNTQMARSYAQVIAGYIDDCSAAEPITVIELGAGPGRLAFALIQALMAVPAMTPGSFRYVVTDLVKENVEHAAAHPWFQELAKQGIVDFATFDMAVDASLCRLDGSTVSVSGPVVVVANYVFDSVPIDGFVVRDGSLFEALATVSTPNHQLEPPAPGLLRDLVLTFSEAPVRGSYYDHPVLNQVLAQYVDEGVDRELRIPVVAVQALERLHVLGDGRLLLLSADNGGLDNAHPLLHQLPVLTTHGCFSMAVNYDAISRVVALRGGHTMSSGIHDGLAVVGFVLGASPVDWRGTRRGFHFSIASFSPGDFYLIKCGMGAFGDALTLSQTMAWLRVSSDPEVFRQHLGQLVAQVEDADPAVRMDLLSLVRSVWANYLPIGEEADLAFGIGVLMCAANTWVEGLAFFQLSWDVWGANPETAYNITLCHHELGHPTEARHWAGVSAKLMPSYGATQELRHNLALLTAELG